MKNGPNKLIQNKLCWTKNRYKILLMKSEQSLQPQLKQKNDKR